MGVYEFCFVIGMQVFKDEGGCLMAERGGFSLAFTWVSLMILIWNVKGYPLFPLGCLVDY